MSKFQNLDVKDIVVFGRQSKVNWLDMIANNESFSKIDKKAFESSLKKNVESTYMRLCSFDVRDLDTDIDYLVFFDNNLKLWDLQFKENKSEDVDFLPNEKFDIIRNDYVKKVVAKAYEILVKANETYMSRIKDHLERGELLAVDETHLEAISSFISDQTLMLNFKARKFKR